MDDDAILDIPLCSDPDDQMFLRLAAAGRAQVLVTGDRAILAPGEPVPGCGRDGCGVPEAFRVTWAA